MTKIDPPAGAAGEPGLSAESGLALGEAHAKAILIGEHSVVYGHPAIAIPVTSLRTVARVSAETGPIRFGIDGSILAIDELPARIAPIGEAARVALRSFGLPEADVLIRLRTGIPPAAGLGGSAAVAHAVIEAVRRFAGGELTEAERFELVQAAERVAHGNPSGLDATATRARTPILFHAGATRPLAVGAPMWLVLGDTGVRGSTSDAVARVRGFVDAHPGRGAELLDLLARMTGEAERLLAAGDVGRLGPCLDRAHDALVELGVGHDAIDELVAAARAGGARGVKITGAGCGGCVLALADSAAAAERLSHAMTEANAVASWVVEVEPTAGRGAR